jgi:hypothetical protein
VEYKSVELRYFPITATRPLQFRFSCNIGILVHEHRIFSESHNFGGVTCNSMFAVNMAVSTSV